jgi:hypothetical protein
VGEKKVASPTEVSEWAATSEAECGNALAS